MTLQITGNDSNGSPLLSLSAGSSSVFAWSPFGSSALRSGASVSLPGFNGERQDPLSGASHLGNGYRAYSPALRRFTCPDSESPFGGGGINPYVYCVHDPINLTDPDGHMPLRGEKRNSYVLELDMEAPQGNAMLVALPGPSEAGTSSAEKGATGVSKGITENRQAPATMQESVGLRDAEPIFPEGRGATKKRGSINGSDPASEQAAQPRPPLSRTDEQVFAIFDQDTGYQAWNWRKHAHRNIAFMDFDLENGHRSTIFSVSGMGNVKYTVGISDLTERKFKFFTVVHSREFDSELKLLEVFTKKFPDTQTKGVLSIHSELTICASCNEAIEQFKRKYPHIKVIKKAQGRVLRTNPQWT
jgi:RHS repeat-associated protein